MTTRLNETQPGVRAELRQNAGEAGSTLSLAVSGVSIVSLELWFAFVVSSAGLLVIARKLVESFPVGSTVSVAVNPENPASAILDTGVPELWIAVWRTCLVLVAVGSLILLYAVARVDASLQPFFSFHLSLASY